MGFLSMVFPLLWRSTGSQRMALFWILFEEMSIGRRGAGEPGVGASSLERLAVEDSLTELTRRFKKIPVNRRPADR